MEKVLIFDPQRKRASRIDAPREPLGTVLFFTGVRYERMGDKKSATAPREKGRDAGRDFERRTAN